MVPGRLVMASLPAGAYGRGDPTAQGGCDAQRSQWDGRDDNGRIVPAAACTSPSSSPTACGRRRRCTSRLPTDAVHDARHRHRSRCLRRGVAPATCSRRRSCRLLIDCGSGITRRLAERGSPWQTITHVAITHFHIDHHGDLPTLIFAWRYGFLPARTTPRRDHRPGGNRRRCSSASRPRTAHG